jgi:transcriptional regulator with XRE-family HTH domain
VSNSFPHAQKQLAMLVKARRLVLGISQEELAHQAGIDRTYASQIERGIGNPSLRVICGLASVLGVEPSSLLDQNREI